MLFPLPLNSWHPAAPCSLRKLCIERLPIYKVPDMMGSLGNIQVLALLMFCVRPEDIEILGALPGLVFSH
ncbi:hypothetical protein ACP4OV_026785 [Aristida adscensionis]